MPRGWRFAARFTVWRRTCASADPPRLRTDIARAFADRASIDWAALITRLRDPADRELAEDLRQIDWLRSPASVVPTGVGSVRCRSLALRLLLATAVLQAALGLAMAAAALVGGQPLSDLPARLLLTLAFAGAGLLLGSASPRDDRVVFLLAAFVFAASAFLRVMPIGLSSSPANVLFRGVFPEAFAPAALWQFAVAFPHVRRFTPFDVFARRAATAAWMLGTILFVVNMALAYRVLDGVIPAALGRDHPGNLFWHLFALTALSALLTVFARSHRAQPAERRKILRFAAAILTGAAPFLVSGVVRMALPGVNDWVLAADPRERLWLDALVLGALTAMPVLTTLAVIVDRPFELPSSVPGPLRGWMAIVVGGLVTVCHPSRGPAGHRKRLTAALERVRLARGSRELALTLSQEVQSGVGARAVSILAPASLPADTALIPMLRESTAALDLSTDGQLFALMPRRDREWLTANRIVLAAPLNLRDGTIAAVIALEAKHGHSQFDSGDRWFISTLLTGAAAAWDSLRAPASEGDGEESALECSGCGSVGESQPLPCGCATRAIPAALPLRLAGKFTVLRRLGTGGMGVVYLARDNALDREVALKTLPALADGAVSRLTDEARAMAALNHEALGTIYGLELWRQTPVLVVEYCRGGTLADRLRRGPLSLVETLTLGIRLAEALSYMHACGGLHRDIKPGNIGLTASGAPKLLDFGLATDHGAFAGTPAYLPPEALDGALPDAAVDLWGLSVVLLEACGGRGRMPAALAPFFNRALAPGEETRFQSADEWRAALEGVAAVLESAAGEPIPTISS